MAERDGRQVGDRIRQLREEFEKRSGRRFYGRDAARVLGIPEDRYRSYEYGRAEFPESLARTLAGHYGISWEEFYRPQQIELNIVDGSTSVPVPHILVPIPYAGIINASAKMQWTDPYETDTTVPLPPEMAGRGHFCCRIEGDSCFDLLWPKDIAVFKPDPSPAIGQMVYYRDNENFVTVKQLKHDGKNYILHPLNPKYPDEIGLGQAIGYLIGIYRKEGSRTITICDLTGIRP